MLQRAYIHTYVKSVPCKYVCVCVCVDVCPRECVCVCFCVSSCISALVFINSAGGRIYFDVIWPCFAGCLTLILLITQPRTNLLRWAINPPVCCGRCQRRISFLRGRLDCDSACMERECVMLLMPWLLKMALSVADAGDGWTSCVVGGERV